MSAAEPTQAEQLLALLRARGDLGVTPLVALEHVGSLRLAARVWDLRAAGHDVRREMVKVPGGKAVARYTLVEARPRGEQLGLSL